MPKIVFIESSDVGTRYCAEGARLLGFEPLFVSRLSDQQGDTRARLLEQCVVVADTSDATCIVEALRASPEAADVAAVITFLDSRLGVAIEVAERLGVHALDRALLALRNKARVVELVPEHSPETFTFRMDEVPSRVALYRFLAGRPGRDFVIKPALAAGALGLGFVAASRAETMCEQIFAIVHGVTLPAHLASPEWLVQTRVAGELVSLEGFVLDGAVHTLGITGRGKVGSTESRVIFPERAARITEHMDAMRDAVRTLTARSGFRNGYFHSEVLVGERTCVLIDANFGRIGGGTLIEQIALAYGMQESEVAAHVMSVALPALRGDAEQGLRPTLRGDAGVDTLGILYGVAREGHLEGVRGVVTDEPRVRATRLLDDGQFVPAMGTNNWGWVGTLSGPAEVVMRIATAARASVRIDDESREEALCF